MITKLNFTGRIDLPLENLEAEVVLEGDKYRLKMKWDFSAFNLDPNCEVILDIRSVGTTETRRLSLGKLSDGISTADIDISRSRNPLAIRLRLKIVSSDVRPPMLRAQLDNFRPSTPTGEIDSKSILKIQKDDGLDLPWVLRVDAGEPILVITGKHDVYSKLKHQDSIFIPSIMSEVVRQVFLWRLKERDLENQDVAKAWQTFFIDLGCDETLFEDATSTEDLDDRNTKIQEMSESLSRIFAQKHQLVEQIRDLTEVIGEET